MTGNTGILPYPPIDATGASLPPSRIAQGGASTGQVLTWTGSAWAPQTPTGGGGDAGWIVHSHTVISGSPNAVEVALPTGNDGRIIRIECHGLGITADSATNLWVADISRDGGTTWITTGETVGHGDRSSDGSRGGTGRANSSFFACLWPNAGGTISVDERYWGWIAISQVFTTGPVHFYSEWNVIPKSNTLWVIARHTHTDNRTTPTFNNARVDRVRLRTLNNNTLVNGGIITVLRRHVP